MQRLPGWTPRDYRAAVALSGAAELPDGRSIEVEITDLSPGGCRVQSNETLEIGQQLKLRIESFEPLSASVRWSLLGRAGLRFPEGATS